MPDGSLSSNRERSGRVNGVMAMIGWGDLMDWWWGGVGGGGGGSGGGILMEENKRRMVDERRKGRCVWSWNSAS